MNTLHHIKRNARRRRASGGAVIFIVAMTLAVLASLGLYALQSASTEVKTSGYTRQNAQSHYLSEYGTLTGVNAMSGTTGQLYLGLMQSPTTWDTQCLSLAGVNAGASNLTKSCRRMGSAELGKAWGTSVTPVVAAQPTIAGSLGPYAWTGDFFVEITDPSTGAPMWGIDQSVGLCFQQFTLLAVGLTQPDQNMLATQGVVLTPTAYYGSEGQEMSQARITAGPMRNGCK
jgi:hypothetical protein